MPALAVPVPAGVGDVPIAPTALARLFLFPYAEANEEHCQMPSTPRAGWHNQGLALQSSHPLHYLNKQLLHQQVPVLILIAS